MNSPTLCGGAGAGRDILATVLEKLVVHRFGCLRSVKASLTPVHAFIGPNDSGKSSLLAAIEGLGMLTSAVPQRATSALPFLNDRMPPPVERVPGHIWLGASGPEGSYDVGWGSDDTMFERFLAAGSGATAQRPLRGTSSFRTDSLGVDVLDQFGPTALVRLDPDRLRESSQLIPDDQLHTFFSSRGRGLPGLFMGVLGNADGAFAEIKIDLIQKFPTVQNLRVRPTSNTDVALEVTLTTGEVLNARQMSEGMLYYLAFKALAHIRPFEILLVEEPENGLHPSRIANVMDILTGLAEGPNPTQVIIATHSPLVINELEPEQVSVVTRSVENGTRVTPITKTKNFEQRHDVYALGELWLSYADGIDENELVG